ncbi:MAG TPA: hypothetical protein VI029_13510, partial [Mycobacterium sp.]
MRRRTSAAVPPRSAVWVDGTGYGTRHHRLRPLRAAVRARRVGRLMALSDHPRIAVVGTGANGAAIGADLTRA